MVCFKVQSWLKCKTANVNVLQKFDIKMAPIFLFCPSTFIFSDRNLFSLAVFSSVGSLMMSFAYQLLIMNV